MTLEWAPYGGARHDELIELRREVLRRPLGLDYTPEQLAAEADQMHLGAWDGRRAVGCLVLKLLPGREIQMRQVAVRADAQRKGVGRLLIAEAEAEAKRQGRARMVLHARQPAVAFYEKLGYAVEGEPFVEIGLPHRLMAKNLGTP